MKYILLLLGVAGCWGQMLAAVTLAVDGTSDYDIVVAAQAIPAERHAAMELQHYLKLATGAELPIVAEARPGRPIIQVGGAAGTAETRPDQIEIRTVGDTLILTGARPRGALYAVYTFLEDYCGVRWWASGVETVPERTELTVPEIDLVYAPPFVMREALYGEFSADWRLAVRGKLNGHWLDIPDEWGGHWNIDGFCHTFGQLLPPEVWFDEHPEWYAEIDGHRVTDGQLCLSNPALRAALTEAALQRLRAKYAPIISITQNDNQRYCRCTACSERAVALGGQSGLLLDCVNGTAAAIEREFPEVLVETLAYTYTSAPPRGVVPRDNVLVRLCSMHANAAHPLNSAYNARFRDEITAWSRIAPHLAVWNYVANFTNYLLPHPTWRQFAADVRFFAAHRVIAVFQQGDSGPVGDFRLMRGWVMAKLLWNPELDADALIDEFLQGYYGAAAGALKRCLLIQEEVLRQNPDATLTLYQPDTGGWLPLSSLLAARDALAAARLAVADDPLLADRVEQVALGYDVALLGRFEASKWNTDPAMRAALDGLDLTALLEHTLDELRRRGVVNYGEAKPLSELETQLRRQCGTSERNDVEPEICRGLPDTAWVEIPIENATMFGPYELLADPAAAGGTAVRLSRTASWVVQLTLPKFPDDASREVWLKWRCDAVAGASEAGMAGMYDAGTRYSNEVHLPMEAGGDYRFTPIDTVQLTGTTLLWVMPFQDGLWLDSAIVVSR